MRYLCIAVVVVIILSACFGRRDRELRGSVEEIDGKAVLVSLDDDGFSITGSEAAVEFGRCEKLVSRHQDMNISIAPLGDVIISGPGISVHQTFSAAWSPIWSKSGKSVYFLATDEYKTGTAWFGSKTRFIYLVGWTKEQGFFKLFNDGSFLNAPSRSLDEQKLAVNTGYPQNHVYIVDMDSGETTLLSFLNGKEYWNFIELPDGTFLASGSNLAVEGQPFILAATGNRRGNSI